MVELFPKNDQIGTKPWHGHAIDAKEILRNLNCGYTREDPRKAKPVDLPRKPAADQGKADDAVTLPPDLESRDKEGLIEWCEEKGATVDKKKSKRSIRRSIAKFLAENGQ